MSLGWEDRTYVAALVVAGLRLELLREPLPEPGSVGLDRSNRIRLFLHLHARRVA